MNTDYLYFGKPRSVTCKLMRSHYLYLIFIVLSCCNSCKDNSNKTSTLGQKVPYTSPGLTTACQQAIEALQKETHGVSFVSNTGDLIEKDSIRAILSTISEYENEKVSRNNSYSRKCGNMDFRVWITNRNRGAYSWIEKVMTKVNVPIRDGALNLITITEYDIVFQDKPGILNVQFINENTLESIRIKNTTFRRVSESELVGLDIAKKELHKMKACR